MGHLVQISSLKIHGLKELLVCSIIAAHLLLPQTAEEAPIDCRANTRLLHKQLTKDDLTDTATSNTVVFGSG